jgi:serine-type D-Ala-D-Ala carboxypeptidase (penicillin-binding protein 5/6)
MLRSGNDAATAIAEHVGGSVEGFVYMMNEKAQHLGLKQTHFTNPHGLDHPEHYSSAKDLAILTSYALKNPVFQEIVRTEVKNVSWPRERWQRKFINKNKLLRMYDAADGVKTGYTKQAGRTLVTSATKKGRQLVCVTLNDSSDWQDHINLFDYGFARFTARSILDKDEIVLDLFARDQNKKRQQLKIVAETQFRYPLVGDEAKQITVKPLLTFPPDLIKHAGLSVGSAQIYLGKRWIGSVPLVSKWQVPTTIWSHWKQMLTSVLTRGGA